MCGFIGESVPLLEGSVTAEAEILGLICILKSGSSGRDSLGCLWKTIFCLPSDQAVDLSDCSPTPCLPTVCHASSHDDNELKL